MENLNIEQLILHIQEFINSIPEVISSKVVLDDEKEHIVELHILATNKRNAKQISRDIQSTLMAKFNIKIDHKKISIAQIDTKEDEELNSRLEVGSIAYSVEGNLVEIKVVLKKGEEESLSVASGTNATRNVYRLVAQATLNCVHEFLGVDNVFIVEDIEKSILAKKEIINVAITFISDRGEDLLVGSSMVRKNEYEAVIKATLDAINRKVGKF
ncbi:hypothetical protein [Anaeromicrobium sediminis]|uniref:Uncharacterized protein n=1 Tax=Anaeromicrobium sediminis TaxID=1478221 RepID=A0A267MEQ0_9FIRM|nr:hypothetical protein [Anaeromicrobium sediminis]PAB57872.1 hypothetical protein CCE28_17910 [Anaeromicrobium sediminis]